MAHKWINVSYWPKILIDFEKINNEIWDLIKCIDFVCNLSNVRIDTVDMKILKQAWLFVGVFFS